MRFLSKLARAWSHACELLARPRVVPRVALAALRGVHPGMLLRLIEHERQLAAMGLTTVLDVGANTGQFALAILEVLPDARLVAFEPVPQCHAELERRLARHPRCSAVRVAVSDRAGTARFHRTDFSPSSSLLAMTPEHVRAFPWTASGADIEVPTARLDDLVPDLEPGTRALLKIDVQGAERLVLAGATKTLDRVQCVMTEVAFAELYHGQPTFEDLHALLRERGFVFAGTIGPGSLSRDHGILEADVLFVRPQRQGLASAGERHG